MCDAKEREMVTCEKLVSVLKENGRCTYHEEITTGIANLKGKVHIILLIQGIILGIILTHTLRTAKGNADAKLQPEVTSEIGLMRPAPDTAFQRSGNGVRLHDTWWLSWAGNAGQVFRGGKV